MHIIYYYVEACSPDLGELIEVLYPVANKWEFLGLVLRVKTSELSKIEAENQKDCSKCLLEMLKWWLNNVPNPSWSSIAKALKSIENNKLAEKVTETYCSHLTSCSTPESGCLL